MGKIHRALLFISPGTTAKHMIDINPLQPLGLAYIAAVLEQKPVEVKIVDCLTEGWNQHQELDNDMIRIGLSFDEIRDIIADYQPDLVGVNHMFTRQWKNAHKIYELSKQVNPKIVTVAGGAHPTVMPEQVLEDPHLDFAVIGEGEETICDLIEVLDNKKDIATLDGIGYRSNGKTRIQPKTRYIEDLDALPFPARHLLNMEKYYGHFLAHGHRTRERFSSMITSRGCPALCTFCTAHWAWGRKFRPRSVENVIAEMREMKDKYGIEEIVFEDDNFNLNQARIEKILDRMISEKFNFAWDPANGLSVWPLTERIIDKMKASGCTRLKLGVESGNQQVLDRIIKKPVRLDKLKPLIRHAQKINLDIGFFLIIGMPGETREQIMDTFRFARELEIYEPFVTIATPYPGSELFELCKTKGYLSSNYSLENLFIRGYTINTPEWSVADLQQMLLAGREYLYFAFLKDHPLRFLHWFVLRFIGHPRPMIRRLLQILVKRLRLPGGGP